MQISTPETKEQSKQWTRRGGSAPKKAKAILSANKVMVAVFWDARGVIHINYLQKGKTINGEYNRKILGDFDKALKEKRPHSFLILKNGSAGKNLGQIMK